MAVEEKETRPEEEELGRDGAGSNCGLAGGHLLVEVDVYSSIRVAANCPVGGPSCSLPIASL